MIKALTNRRDHYRKEADNILQRLGLFTDEWAYHMRMANLYNSLMIKILLT